MRGWVALITNPTPAVYTETQLEQAFNLAIFSKVLGYRQAGEVPGGAHHMVPKRTGQTGRDFPDLVLGNFRPSASLEQWVAVVEIKPPGTDLDRPQKSRTNSETPVEQAFRYARTGRPGVRWIIVTNMEELRLYQNGFAAAWVEWSLASLDDPRKLREFISVLYRDRLLPATPMSFSHAEVMLSVSAKAGQKLTREFFDVYNKARTKAIETLKPQVSPDASAAYLIGKADKLLHRVLFACFCEDHVAELLPAFTTRSVRESAEVAARNGTPIIHSYREFFRALDAGGEPVPEITVSAFNGGLFAYDSFLDNCDLPDEVFLDPISVGPRAKPRATIPGILGFDVFDFRNDLDVDALGTLFERTLGRVPEKSVPVRGFGTREISKRERFGVVYTAKAVTEYLVERALQEFLAPIRRKLLRQVNEMSTTGRRPRAGKKALSAEETRDLLYHEGVLEELKDLTIIDPACGSGAFLVQALESLHRRYDASNNAIAQISGAVPMFGINSVILRNNLYGTDLLHESVEIAKLSLWLRTAAKDEKLASLDGNLIESDGLREGARDGTFNLVIGNPPWGAELQGWAPKEAEKRFPNSGQEKDTFAFFIQRAGELLEPGGVLAFVLPNSWLTVAGYEPLRRWILSHFEVLEVVNTWLLFHDVNTDTCLLVARKRSKPLSSLPTKRARNTGRSQATINSLPKHTSLPTKHISLGARSWAAQFRTNPMNWALERSTRFETIYSPRQASALDTIARRCRPLGEVCSVTVGIQVYHQRNVPKEFIKKRGFHSRRKKSKRWYRFLKGNDIQRYFHVRQSDEFLKYDDKLCDKRELKHYKEEFVLIQQVMWGRLSATWFPSRKEPLLYQNSLFAAYNSQDPNVDLACIAAILNSRFASAAFGRWVNRILGEKFPKVSALDLSPFPLPKLGPGAGSEISKVSMRLQTRWGKAKELAEEFWAIHDRREFARFWDSGFLDEHGLVLSTQGKGIRNRLLKKWSEILEDERNLEEQIKIAYGIEDELHAELLDLVPEIALDVLRRPDA